MIPLSKGKSKYLRSLRRRKIRFQERCFILEGEKMCLELIQHFPESIELLLLSELTSKTIEADVLFLREKLILASHDDFKDLTELENNPGFLAVVKMPSFDELSTEKGRFIYLDGIQDPGNLGGIFRTAAWYGVDGVIIGPGTVDPYNPKAIQASMGAILQVPHYFVALKDVLSEKHGNSDLMGLDLAGNNIGGQTLPSKGILVLGSEGQGILPETRTLINQWLTIPKAKNSKMESLNAGVAVAIALDHWFQK